MAEGMRVSGVGKGARRTDLDRAAKIQRDAKIQNAAGGAYGQRAELQGLAQGASMQGSFDPARVRMGEERSMNAAASIPTVGIFERTQRPNEPITAGVDAGDMGETEVAALFGQTKGFKSNDPVVTPSADTVEDDF